MSDSTAGVAAVVFDLYDTLVIVAPEERRAHQRGLASRLGLSFKDFDELWRESSLASNLGHIGATVRRFDWVRDGLAKTGSDDLSYELAEAEHHFLRNSVRVVVGIPELLVTVRAAGIRTWLLSNCSPSVEHTLNASGLRALLDGESLSCDVGFAKPDPGLFRHALIALDQPVERTLYVADGMVSELTAARTLGMPAARVTWSHSQGEQPDGVPSLSTVGALRHLILPSLDPPKFQPEVKRGSSNR